MTNADIKNEPDRQAEKYHLPKYLKIIIVTSVIWRICICAEYTEYAHSFLKFHF